MDNSKRNVHNSGPLGMLMKTGQVKKVDEPEDAEVATQTLEASVKTGSSYFKTQAGLEFSENELVYVDPKECEPWKYANRQEDEMGNLDELIESIKINKQLQPALVRKHPNPHDGIEYEIIFGRRRHLACLTLGIPFLVIRKSLSNIQEAVASQDAENKFRNDISHYSNAVLYKRLLQDEVFTTEKELAEKLRMPTSSFNDLMAFTKIPQDVVKKIPDIHKLSKIFAVKLVSLLNKSKKHYAKIVELAPQIGKSITSPVRLQRAIDSEFDKKTARKSNKSKLYKSQNGKKLFTLKYDQRGAPSIVMNKETVSCFDIDSLCDSIKALLDKELLETGYPD